MTAPRKPRYLVTGGAGYIGSHIVLALRQNDCDVTVFDSLAIGHREAVPADVRLIHGDIADSALMDQTLADGPWDCIFHFAALSQVGDSYVNPGRYFAENAVNGINLVRACVTHGVFAKGTTAKLARSPIKELVFTDTIGYRFEPLAPCCKVISVAGLFAEAILSIHRRESVSRLFEFERAEGALT